MSRRKLPIGIQTFRTIREEGCYYVDKTAHIRRLVDEGTHYFLSRPRRFGKSLFLDTCKELFEGNEALFEGLAVHGHMGLVGAPSGGAPELRQRALPGTGRPAHGGGGSIGGAGEHVGGRRPPRERSRSPRPRDQDAARAHRPAGRRSRRRVRQAHSRCAGRTGGGAREPRLPARSLLGRQGQRRPRPIHLHHRGEQVLQGEPLLRPQQSYRHHAGSSTTPPSAAIPRRTWTRCSRRSCPASTGTRFASGTTATAGEVTNGSTTRSTSCCCFATASSARGGSRRARRRSWSRRCSGAG